MTRRRNALSVDELRLEEEGYASPTRRQRLAETDLNTGNVETGLVSDASSEWSDWFNGSSSRASNESTTSSWDSPLSDEGSRGNASSWGSPPLNFDEDSGENVISWDSLLFDEDSGENMTSSSASQISSNTASPNGWWTGGANGLQTADTESFEVEDVPYSSNPKETLIMEFPDAIKCITEKKYLDLTKFGLPRNYSAERIRKVVASIVIKREVIFGNSRLCIVSLGAGSKVIDGRSLSDQGDRVHDCHAEVLARRGMLRFLYAQLEKIKNGCQHRSIFVKSEGSDVYTIRDGVSFHLFISKPPCGDASVFGQHEFHPNCLNRGIARATPSNGEGAVYIPEENKTFDHFKHGARLHKMCCSDKIARWNVIGIQGALLSLYIRPVYLSSITIGGQFHDGHLKRAVYGRVSKIQELPPHYHINDPKLYHVSKPDDTTEKSHKMSLNWYLHDHDIEPQVENAERQLLEVPHVVSAANNRGEELIECQYGKPPTADSTCYVSRLSKRELFKCFASLWNDLASRTLKQKLPLRISTGQEQQLPYSTVKTLAKSYQEAKGKVAKCFADMPYGSRWLKMPPEVDQFSLPDSDDEGPSGDTGDNNSSSS